METLVAPWTIASPNGTTTRVSVASDGTEGNNFSGGASLSADWRFVAFLSFASNLVPGDTNGVGDVFVHDRQTGTTTRVSVASDGTKGNSDSAFVGFPSISADGRFVAFESFASNLVPGDTNGTLDVFVHDRQTGTTTRVSVASDGTEGNDQSLFPSISSDGHFVAFWSIASNLIPNDSNTCGSIIPGSCSDIFVHDRQMGITTRVSVASDGTESNGASESPSISADGRFVAFESFASNLVPSDTNGAFDIFVHDRQTGTITRVSIASDGTEGNSDSRSASISADGRFVAFHSFATNLIPGDTNFEADVFVHDRQTGTTTRVSIASDGSQANSASGSPSISDEGHSVVFDSAASNLVLGDTNGTIDVFVHDLESPVSPLEIFDARAILSINTPGNDHFFANGSFTLGDTSNGIDPVAEPVSFSLADMDGIFFTQTLPPDSFKTFGKGGFLFHAPEGSMGIRLMIVMPTKNAKNYTFNVLGKKFDLNGADNPPVTISLQIGDDTGSEMIPCQNLSKVLICR